MNHFSNVCRRKQDSALALVACSSDNNTPKENEITLSMQPLNVKGKNCHPTDICVLPDTGANICLAGDKCMTQLGLSNSNLYKASKTIVTAGGFKLKSFGWIEVLIVSKSKSTTQKVYFSHQVHRFYLSKAACIELCLIPAGFPHCNAILKAVDKPSNSNSKQRSLPIKPDKMPFDPDEKNIDKLELYLKEAFSSSAFNPSPPFPEMANITPAKIHLKHGAVPHVKHTPIPIPLHWRETIKQQLDDDVLKGVIEPVPVGEAITWCSQMVIVQKKDGSPRRTVDYQKLNSQCNRETHHCQPPFRLATQIPPNTKKTIFDAVDGYHAVPLHPESKHLTTFITPWGAYRYCRLPQGFVASADAYTRRYDELISHIPRKVKCIDDVLLWDKDIESAFYRAWDFLEFCAENGIVISEKKFKFCKDEVEFAGLQVTQSGIAPSKKIIQAIQNFPTPKSLTDARSWFGLINQVAWAYSDNSLMNPFRELIKPKNPFYWDKTLQDLFEKSKLHIVNLVKEGVSTFDISKPTCIQTDWSQQGVGFLLLQKYCNCSGPTVTPACCKTGWKLTFAGSRFTTESESRYSPTEGEALAVAWSLHKAKFFTLGCKNLIVATDHQPLLGLFRKQLDDILNPRLLRLREKTLMFNFDVVYTPGVLNKGADAISRNPVSQDVSLIESSDTCEELHCKTICIIANLNDSSLSDTSHVQYSKLRKEINEDESYRKLQNLVCQGFPVTKEEMDPQVLDFWNVKDRLSQTSAGIILLDDRIVIPVGYRKQVLQILHSAHQGICAMKRRANESVFWPYINRDIKNTRVNCKYCNEVAPRQTKEPLILSPDPEFPFQQIAADYFTIKGHEFLVLVDRYSGWLTISYFKSNTATSSNLIHECIALFSAYGAPEVFSSDGGPQFKSHEFKRFLEDWGISHRLSSAHYPQSNGRAEAAVKTAKRVISDYVSKDGPDTAKIAAAMLQHRNTPLPDLRLSPSQLLFHRRLRDKLPACPTHYQLHKEWILTSKQREVLFQKKNSALMRRYNRVSNNLEPLKPATKVLLLTGKRNPRWSLSGIVVMCLPFRQYKIKLDGSGRIVLRNRRFLREYHHTNDPLNVTDSYPLILTPSAEGSTMSSHQHTSQATEEEIENIVTQNKCPDANKGEKLPHMLKRLLPHNSTGLSEGSGMLTAHTTRSGGHF